MERRGKYKYPYLSLDHLKMGLIRSGNTTLTPMSDDQSLTDYLWPIVREMIKTAIENKQNLVVEGYYIPFDWAKDFEKEYSEMVRRDNAQRLEQCIRYGAEYILIDEEYQVDIELSMGNDIF